MIASRVYDGANRVDDGLSVNWQTIDDYLAKTQILKRQKVRSKCAATAPQLRSSNEPQIVGSRARAGAALELPKPNTSSSELAAKELSEEEEISLRKLIKKCREKIKPCPQRLEPALRQAIANGFTVPQLWERCGWFCKNQFKWTADNRPGAFHDGLAKTTPDMSCGEGWPYQGGQVEARR